MALIVHVEVVFLKVARERAATLVDGRIIPISVDNFFFREILVPPNCVSA